MSREKGYRWVLGGAVVVCVGLAVVVGCQGRARGTSFDVLIRDLLQDLQGKTHEWFGGEKDQALVASGTIQADEVQIGSELGGRITRIHVRTGAEVQAGEVLVSLDVTTLLDRLAEAETAVAVAEAERDAVRAGSRAEEILAAQAKLEMAVAESDGAFAAWQNALQALQNPQDLDAQIVEAQTQVKLAEQAAILAEAELARERLIRDQKRSGSVERDIADWQVKAAGEKLAAAKADHETAQALLDQLAAIRRRPLGLIVQAHLAEGQYRVAESGMVVAQARLDDLLAGPTPEEIAVAETAVRVARAKADALLTQEAKFMLTSPVDGVVLSEAMYAGEVAAPWATILTLADLRRVTLTVYVPTNRIGEVHLGQAVQVTVDSFPGRVFAGQVARIGSEPEYTPRNVATQEERVNTFYAVEIRLDNEDRALKPGMPADAAF